jgi:hypothetical protein
LNVIKKQLKILRYGNNNDLLLECKFIIFFFCNIYLLRKIGCGILNSISKNIKNKKKINNGNIEFLVSLMEKTTNDSLLLETSAIIGFFFFFFL